MDTAEGFNATTDNDDYHLSDNWTKLPHEVQVMIMTKLDDEKKLDFVDDHDFSWVGRMVKTFTMKVTDVHYEQNVKKDLELFKRCRNVTTLIVKIPNHWADDDLLSLAEEISDINPNLESIQVTHIDTDGPSGVHLGIPIRSLISELMLVSYIKANLKKYPGYDGSKIKDPISMYHLQNLRREYPKVKLNLEVNYSESFEGEGFTNFSEEEYTSLATTIVTDSVQWKFDGNIDHNYLNLDCLHIRMWADNDNSSSRQLFDILHKQLKRVVIYNFDYEYAPLPKDQFLPKTPTSNIIDFTSGAGMSVVEDEPHKRIFQVKKNLLIITNRFKTPPIRDIVSKFLNVDTIIFEVYGEVDHRNLLIKNELCLTEEELREKIEVIRVEDGRALKLIVTHEK